MAVALFYFLVHIALAIAGVVVVLSISALIVAELRARRKAEERLSER
jgi:hypothetical protein